MNEIIDDPIAEAEIVALEIIYLKKLGWADEEDGKIRNE